MLWKLVGIRFRAMYASAFQTKTGAKRGAKRGGGVGKLLLVGLLGLYMLVVFGVLFFSMFSQLGEAFLPADGTEGNPVLYFAVAGLLVLAVNFFLGVFAAQSQLFEAKDNAILFSMPIPAKTILASRVVFLLLSDYLYSLLIVVPAALVYGMRCGFTLWSAAGCLAGFLWMPLIAETLCCLFGWLLALATSRMSTKIKTGFQVALSLLVLALYFMVYFNAQNTMNALIQNSAAIAEHYQILLSPFLCFGRAATGSLTDIAILTAAAWIPFAVTLLLLARFSLRLVTPSNGSSSRRKTAVRSPGKEASSLKGRSLMNTLVARERKRFFSSSVYLLNGGMSLIIVLILVVAAAVQRNTLLEMLGTELSGMFLPILTIGVVYVFCMTMISACSLSLEMNTLWILQSIPVDGGKLLLSKAYFHMQVCAPFVVIVGVVLNLFFDGSIAARIAVFALPAAVVTFQAYFGVFVNLRMPRFDWASEAAAVKSGGATAVTMFSSFGGFLVLTIVGFVLAMVTGLPVEWFLLGCSVLLAGICVGLHQSLAHSGERFAKLNT